MPDNPQGIDTFLANVDILKVSKELEFTIGQVEFSMKRMNSWDAWPVLCKVREKMLGSLAVGNLQSALSIPHEFLRNEIFRHLAEHTWFKTPEFKKGKRILAGNEQVAFNPDFDVEATDIYELIGRFLCVNFPNLLRRIVSQIGSDED